MYLAISVLPANGNGFLFTNFSLVYNESTHEAVTCGPGHVSVSCSEFFFFFVLFCIHFRPYPSPRPSCLDVSFCPVPLSESFILGGNFDNKWTVSLFRLWLNGVALSYETHAWSVRKKIERSCSFLKNKCSFVLFSNSAHCFCYSAGIFAVATACWQSNQPYKL